MGNTFPTSALNLPDTSIIRLNPLPLAREVALQIGRLNHHAEKLSDALKSLAAINRASRMGDWARSEEIIARHRDEFGLSLVLLRKDLLTSFQILGPSGLSRRYRQTIQGADNSAWALLAHIIYDLMDPAYNPERAANKWLRGLEQQPQKSNWYKQLAMAEILTCWRSKSTLADALLRYNATSLLDLALCLWKARAVHQEWRELDAIDTSLAPNLINILQNEFSAHNVSVPGRYYFKSAGPSDVNVFRATFFFQEDAGVAHWRSSFMRMLYPRLAGTGIATPPFDAVLKGALYIDRKPAPEGQFETKPEKNGAPVAIIQLVLEDQVSITSDDFVTSVVSADLLRRFDPAQDLSPEEVISVLTGSANIYQYVDSEAIHTLLSVERYSQHGLLVFLLRDVLFSQERTHDNELDRRAAFMEMFAVGGRQEIVPMLNEVSKWSMRAARYIARLCSRSFLERLYLLVESVKEVLETRIALCNWLLANDVGVGELTDELDALERELTNLDARSDLDSTRVHVDEDSLREWYNGTQKAEELRYKQTIIAEDPLVIHGTFLDFYNRIRERSNDPDAEDAILADSQIGSEFILLSICEATLRAFVSDKTFGLDSYLSRRIRHGTLRGFLTTPLSRVRRRLVEDANNEERLAERENYQKGIEQLDIWFARLAEHLDRLRRDIIQVTSAQHPSGLIEATWRTPTNVRHLDAMMARTRKRVIEEQGNYDIFTDVHLLCWDLLERDLAQLRRHLTTEFLRGMTAELSILYKQMSLDCRRETASYWGEIASILNSRVQEVCGWFIRPVFRHNSYYLRNLVESTVSTIRELDENFSFHERVQISDSLTVNRGSFDVLGDILFVLIGNAAKHGKSGGLVQIAAEIISSDIELVRIEVVSEVESFDALKKAETRMRRATDQSDIAVIQSAGVLEGFSGLRKVIGLLHRVRTSEARFALDCSPEALSVSCLVFVPSTIAFARERA